MEITKQDFLQKVEELASRNWKVRKLLDTKGGFDKLIEHQKHLIAKEIGCTYQKNVKVTETFTAV